MNNLKLEKPNLINLAVAANKKGIDIKELKNLSNR
jgi:hypothetical protein